MKKLLYLLIIVLEGIVYYLMNIVRITIPCFFKLVFKTPCPACGLTRSFHSIFHFDLISAIHYNILIIPIVILLLIINSLLILDIIKNKDLTKNFVLSVSNHYKIIITLLLISEVINIYHNI